MTADRTGAAVAERLRRTGFIELDDDTARAYSRSMNASGAELDADAFFDPANTERAIAQRQAALAGFYDDATIAGVESSYADSGFSQASTLAATEATRYQTPARSWDATAPASILDPSSARLQQSIIPDDYTPDPQWEAFADEVWGHETTEQPE
jgi:hypothetical protein